MNSESGALYGALAGWRRVGSQHGATLTIQLAGDRRAWETKNYRLVHVTMNDRQLRSLARDLARAANARGLDLGATRPWWRLWARRVRKRMSRTGA